jgi:hypothetical protein
LNTTGTIELITTMDYVQVSTELINNRTYIKYKCVSNPSIKLEVVKVDGKPIQIELTDLLWNHWYIAPINNELKIGCWQSIMDPLGDEPTTIQITKNSDGLGFTNFVKHLGCTVN